MRGKKKYEAPQVEVVEARVLKILCASSGPVQAGGAGFQNYVDGNFSW